MMRGTSGWCRAGAGWLGVPGAFLAVASILALLRITRGPASSRAVSAGCDEAILAGSEPPDAARMPSHLAVTIRPLMSAWKTARHRCSKKNAGSSEL